MFARSFFARHPVLREALLWSVPALLVGTVLRALLLWALPYAFWGADSRSYFSFAYQLLVRHSISLEEKRRYLYPFLMVPVAMLPGAALRWIALLQHLLGIVSLVPLAYLVRKTTVHWRCWMVPVTVVYAALPVIIWYEQELLGENVFFAALLWAFAGWAAWVSEARAARAARLFWWFFVPLAFFFLTKPSGRFVWPGLLLGMLLSSAWRRLSRWHVTALLLLFAVTLTVGSRKQGAWLLYTAVFPLTQLHTPLHADYKAEIADMVEPLAQRLDLYYQQDGGPFQFLARPGGDPKRPLWSALGTNPQLRAKIYFDLATEGIKARPMAFLYLGVQRLIASADLSAFRQDRFTGRYYRGRTEHFYAEAERDELSPLRLAFGLPKHGAVEPYTTFQSRLDPKPGSAALHVVHSVLGAVGRSLDVVRIPHGAKSERTIERSRPTVLGWWLFAAGALAFAPAYRKTYGVWTLIACWYLMGVFVVSQRNPRYFAPVWPILIPLLAVPADAIVERARRWREGRPGSSEQDSSKL